ncbi:MAG: alpha/beta hydrolase [Actinomycetota bacterium]
MFRRPPTTALAALALVVVLAACDSGGEDDAQPGTPTTAPTPVAADPGADVAEPVLVWDDCGDLECATLTVPIDHDDPDGSTVGIAVARAPADDDDPIGSLIVNPGGPGASGIDFLRNFALAAPAELRDRFALVSFDPRGVGRSSSIDCGWVLDEDRFDPIDASDDLATRVEASLTEAVEEAQQCADAVGELLPHVGTVATARDLDLLRTALGDDALTYLGFSYGTRIGAVYAELFPDRVRALVLDAADRIRPQPDDTLQQYVAFESAFETFAAACGALDGCPLGPGEAEQIVAEIDAELRTRVLDTDSSLVGPDRVLTRDELYVALLTSLYSESQWTTLAAGLELARDTGDGSILQLLTDNYLERGEDGSYSDIVESFTAITCADESYRPTEAEVRAAALTALPQLRVFAPVAPDIGVDCFGWPAPVDPLPETLDAVGAPPIVVVGTTGDPATPYRWAVDMATELDSAVLVTYEGVVHTAFFSSSCVRDAAVDYLVDLEVPVDLRCTD